jgi:hypothetical protein
MQTAWYAACLICRMRAACVVGGEGGELYDLFSVALDISYIMTTNFSRILWSSLPSTGGYWLSFLKTVDASGHAFHVCHAVFSQIAQSYQQLMKSGCKTEFRGRCKCYCFSLPCIAMCSCNCGGYNLFMMNSVLQPLFVSCWQLWAIGGSTVQNICHKW